MVFSGMDPVNPIPGRWIPVTRVPFELQVTPTHEVQIEAESLFQLSLGACGTEEANSKRACLSEFKSDASIKLKRDSVEVNRTRAAIENSNFISCLVQNPRQVVIPSCELKFSASFTGLVFENRASC